MGKKRIIPAIDRSADEIEVSGRSPRRLNWTAVLVIGFLSLSALGAGLKYLDDSAKREKAAHSVENNFTRTEPSLLSWVNPFAATPTPTATPQLSKDQALRGTGRVNVSTLGMEFSLPLGSYPGRGVNVPIALSYSSKVWRMDTTGSYPIPVSGGTNRCVAGSEARFAEHSAAGWTSSMQEVYVEYTGYDERFNREGFPLTDGIECIPAGSASNNHASYVRRLQIHLPDGSSHELRMDEQPLKYERSGSCGDPDAPCANNPELAANWNGWYYAANGSNLRYYENRTNNVYVLQLPDGAQYTFDAAVQTSADSKRSESPAFSPTVAATGSFTTRRIRSSRTSRTATGRTRSAESSASRCPPTSRPRRPCRRIKCRD